MLSRNTGWRSRQRMIPRSARARGERALISSPAKLKLPAMVIRIPPLRRSRLSRWVVRPAMVLSRVVLPALLEPKTPTSSPSSTRRLRSFTASAFS